MAPPDSDTEEGEEKPAAEPVNPAHPQDGPTSAAPGYVRSGSPHGTAPAVRQPLAPPGAREGGRRGYSPGAPSTSGRRGEPPPAARREQLPPPLPAFGRDRRPPPGAPPAASHPPFPRTGSGPPPPHHHYSYHSGSPSGPHHPAPPGARGPDGGGFPPFRGGSPPPAAAGDARARAPRSRGADRARAEREEAEREALMEELGRLTNGASFQGVRDNFEAVAADLHMAVKKLDKVLRRIKRKRHDDVDQYPRAAEISGRVFSGIKHVVVLCGTGIARSRDLGPARQLVRAALNYRHDVFSAAKKREMEQLVKDSREFRVLWENRNAPLTIGGRTSADPGRSGGGGADGAARSGEYSGGGAPTCSREESMSGPAAGAASSAARGGEASSATAARTPAPDTSPPPVGDLRLSPERAASPSPPPPVEDLIPMVDDLPPPSQSPAPPGRLDAHSGGGAAASASGQVGFGGAIKIVVRTTADDLPSAAAAASGKRSAPDGSSGGFDSDDAQHAKRARGDAAAAAGAADSDGQGSAPASSGDGVNGAAAGTAATGALPPTPQGPALELQRALGELLGQRRLVLVLDLDHTLLNSAKFNEVERDMELRLEQQVAAQAQLPHDRRELLRLPRLGMWTKLRPGVREFLARCAQRFELWIHTAGNKQYAQAMAEVLDPQQRYFSGRIIAQGADRGSAEDAAAAAASVTKRMMQGLEGREAVAVILDDSSAAWPHDRRNLLVIERYVFFPSSRRKFGMQGHSLLEIERDECARRGMLASAFAVLERLHTDVFTQLRSSAASNDPGVWDVRNIMQRDREQVLAGVVVVFSRVIPLETDPRLHPLWRLAVQFGAECKDGLDDTTTHVVATHSGTEKCMLARQRGIQVVSPAWLECCCILWQRANEERFPTPH